MREQPRNLPQKLAFKKKKHQSEHDLEFFYGGILSAFVIALSNAVVLIMAPSWSSSVRWLPLCQSPLLLLPPTSPIRFALLPTTVLLYYTKSAWLPVLS